MSAALAKKPEHANLIPHVDAMRRANRFGRKRRVSGGNVPTPAPQPSPTDAAEALTN